jgi:hypothetical protein
MPEHRLLRPRGMVLALMVLALTTSLANRFFHTSFSAQSGVHAGSVNNKVQNQDNDAVEWAPPNPHFSLLWISEETAPLISTGQVYVRIQYDFLYNRPPPTL